ncbi:DUF2637 domain-containing protein [Nocardiopsis sp. RV163]|uniref:DUF2637 domain-containing protein n=1 Tax=Nocardiopsis sp. RV163 TaxID=1661388 RepID=UPI00373FDD88
MLAVIAAVVSCSHMYELALRHGEPEWRAALFPLPVDGVIVASSMTLLSDARSGRKGGLGGAEATPPPTSARTPIGRCSRTWLGAARQVAEAARARSARVMAL